MWQKDENPLIIAGHSKGGNLAYFSYFNLDKTLKKRVEKVYNFDGPSFYKDKNDYSEFNTKLFKFVPYDDFIGIIFEKTIFYIPVDTKIRGINAHDLLTREFDKKSNYQNLKRKRNLSLTSKTLQIALNIWLAKLSKKDCHDLVDFIVDIATCNQMKDLFALKLDIIKARKVYLDKIANYNPKSKERLKNLTREFVKSFFMVLLHNKDYKFSGEKVN